VGTMGLKFGWGSKNKSKFQNVRVKKKKFKTENFCKKEFSTYTKPF
jgi:hypothetical protein